MAAEDDTPSNGVKLPHGRRMRAEHISVVAILIALASGGTVSGINIYSNRDVLTELNKNNAVVSKELKDLRDASIETKDAIKSFEKASAQNDDRFKTIESENRALRDLVQQMVVKISILETKVK